MIRHSEQRWIAAAAAGILLLATPIQMVAQSRLKIVVIEGAGAFNNLQARLGRDLLVEVRDEAGAAVADAEVTFALPASGPGGTFRGDAPTQKTRTNQAGQARSQGFTPNDIEGRFRIQINAVKGNLSGSAVAAQTNTMAGGILSMEPKRRSKKLWILGLVGGAAAAGVLAATWGGDSSSPGSVVPPLGVSLGGVTVGGPR